MKAVIEIHKIKAVKVSGEWMEIGKRPAVGSDDCEFQDSDEERIGGLPGGILAFTGADNEDYVVCLADVQAVRMR